MARRRVAKRTAVLPAEAILGGSRAWPAEMDAWPVLRQPAAVLMDQILTGEHDAYLGALERMEQGHGDRGVVLESISLRAAKLAGG